MSSPSSGTDRLTALTEALYHVTRYSYYENRLIRVETTGGAVPQVITYAYDPFGRRIEKNVNGTITRYLYDREDILLEYDQAGTVAARYLHGPGIDEPLAVEKNGQTYCYQADALGSIIALTDSAGAVVQSYQYDAFGNILSGAPTVTQPYTYTAREYDSETGLYYYRARHYDPVAGRFLQRDPIGFAGGDVNLYAYVGNSPLNQNDPTGLKWVWYCTARLGSGGWQRNIVANLYPLFGHCYIKFGDDARGFYTGLPNC